MRDAARENYGPGSIHLYLYKSYQYLAAIIYLLFYFAIYNYLLSSTHFICLQIRDCQPSCRVGCKCLLFCVQPLKTVVVDIPIGLINIGFITEGNTYLLCAAITHSSSRKTQRRSQVSGRISGAVAW